MDDSLIKRQAATQIILEFIVEYLGGAFDEDAQRMLKERLDALPTAGLANENDELIKKQTVIDALYQVDENNGWSIEAIRGLPSTEPEPHWIPCGERLPECEQEVLICTKKKIYISRNSGFEWYEEPIITPALYEDGTMLEVNSKWRWEDIDYAGWDEEEDCGIIPEGWWENRHFNPDEVYNNPVDKEVIAWMPLPECYRGENDG